MSGFFYWAHCRDCGGHMELKAPGVCRNCRSLDTGSCDSVVDEGCAECASIVAETQPLPRPPGACQTCRGRGEVPDPASYLPKRCPDCHRRPGTRS
jgi:hypothetical protein